jgi:hypothetical protein
MGHMVEGLTMTYPCPRCNRDDGYPICAGDDRCQRTDGALATKAPPAHTPGPWRLSHVEDGSIRHLVPVDAGGTSLLTVVNERGYDGCGEPTPFAAVYSDCDARMMVAAPELLEALRLMVAIHDEPAGFAGKYGKALDEAIARQQEKINARLSAARAAILKACG